EVATAGSGDECGAVLHFLLQGGIEQRLQALPEFRSHISFMPIVPDARARIHDLKSFEVRSCATSGSSRDNGILFGLPVVSNHTFRTSKVASIALKRSPSGVRLGPRLADYLEDAAPAGKVDEGVNLAGVLTALVLG